MIILEYLLFNWIVAKEDMSLNINFSVDYKFH